MTYECVKINWLIARYNKDEHWKELQWLAMIMKSTDEKYLFIQRDEWWNYYILDKQFQSQFTGNVYTEIGKVCEDLILEEILPLIEESNQRTIHYEFPKFQLCSTPDAILKDGRVLEIKTKIRDKGRNPITAQHALQLRQTRRNVCV